MYTFLWVIYLNFSVTKADKKKQAQKKEEKSEDKKDEQEKSEEKLGEASGATAVTEEHGGNIKGENLCHDHVLITIYKALDKTEHLMKFFFFLFLFETIC